jgi:threonine synthase
MEPLAGVLRCIYDYETISKGFDPDVLAKRPACGFDRWMELLPLRSAESLPPLITNSTPLRAAENLRIAFNLERLWIKDDSVQPTASFKDRASALVVACARERGRETIATASTGNAATALAGQAASCGASSVIFVPASAPQAKLVQIAVFGGMLVPIKGTYDEAFELSIAACNEFGWYNRNTAYNPFTIEGKKTAALEIWEQLGYKAPDWVVVPTGDGVILAGIEKGFADLKALGLIEKPPKLALVQAEGCQPLVRAWRSVEGAIIPEKKPHTVADSICVGVPRAGRWALAALKECGGAAVAVSDDEIIAAIALLGRSSGVFAEPAAAASIAGVKKLLEEGVIAQDESVVALVTGSGLKDVPAAARSVVIPKAIEPDIEAVRRALKP